MNRALKTIFTLSVTLNLLGIGFLVGHLPFRFPPRPSDLYEFVRVLPDPQATTMRKRVDEMLAARSQDRVTFGGAQDRLFVILTAPVFDADAFRQQLQTLDSMHDNRRHDFKTLVIEMASNMDQKQRVALAEHLRRNAPPVD
ncbi:MAG: periplasmic heavy metal sensor [Holosporaceae bacterium]|jgi:uncharacterized membrane protein|nr:periplasmic heavy metal sensor [Rhodospirillaceae bacterium]